MTKAGVRSELMDFPTNSSCNAALSGKAIRESGVNVEGTAGILPKGKRYERLRVGAVRRDWEEKTEHILRSKRKEACIFVDRNLVLPTLSPTLP